MTLKKVVLVNYPRFMNDMGKDSSNNKYSTILSYNLSTVYFLELDRVVTSSTKFIEIIGSPPTALFLSIVNSKQLKTPKPSDFKI